MKKALRKLNHFVTDRSKDLIDRSIGRDFALTCDTSLHKYQTYHCDIAYDSQLRYEEEMEERTLEEFELNGKK